MKCLKVFCYLGLSIVFVLASTIALTYFLLMFGLEAMLIMLTAIAGVSWGWIIAWLYKDGRITFSHILTVWLVFTGTILGGCSYYLSYRGITSNLETLSKYVIANMIAAPAGYFIKSTVEHIFGKPVNCPSPIEPSTEEDQEVPRDL